ncbi:MAG TPA: hypothetical protein ENN29_12485 [Candidatus Hydrogenedentes bacterium]|nr:hypothetical protein [Candidatus Hydrogenedentota bacterium]
MRIVRVEEICLDILRRAENPLTPVSLIYRKCVEKEGAAALTEEALLQFLRGHGDIVVVEGVADGAPVEEKAFNEAGIMMGPRAILKSRVPTPDELKKMFRMQLEIMRDNLAQALKLAKEAENGKAVHEIETVLEKADILEERMEDL